MTLALYIIGSMVMMLVLSVRLHAAQEELARVREESGDRAQAAARQEQAACAQAMALSLACLLAGLAAWYAPPQPSARPAGPGREHDRGGGEGSGPVSAGTEKAGLADTRRRGGRLTSAALPLARSITRRLRVQFPGRDAENARVLAAVASALRDLERAAAGRGADPAMLTPGLLHVLGLAADDLNQASRGKGRR
jgi:hypothetical protein